MAPRESKRGGESPPAGDGDTGGESTPGSDGPAAEVPAPPRIERSTDAFLKHLLAADAEGDSALPPGSQVGRYVIVDRLGSGGMGVVYKATDPTLDREIALKVMPVKPTGADSAAEASARLLREAQALAKLAHPNVVAVHDVGTVGDDVFVAMELVEGKTLSEWHRDHDPTRAQILEVFTAAGRGIEAAHQANLVHRDFKPENVIVGDDGRVRVLDFGLARAARAADALAGEAGPGARSAAGLAGSEQPPSGGIIGTPAYMAPEQHTGGKVDERTDQFSFCVALHEVLYGEPPFAGKSVAALERAVTEGRVSEAPEDADVPLRLRRILLRGLAASPDDRYPSMTALLSDLEPLAKSRRSKATAFALAAAIALAAAGAIALWQSRGSDSGSACVGADEHLAGAWDPAVKRSVREAFVASGRPHAPATFERVEKVLDGHVAAWVAMRTEACEATRVHGKQPEEVLGLRMRCLDRRLAELRGLTAELSDPANADVIDNALHAAFTLGRLEQCADTEALAVAAPSALDGGGGGGSRDESGCGLIEGVPFNPIEIGRSWVYDVTDPSTGLPLSQEPKVLTVEALEKIGGCKGEVEAFRTRRQIGPGHALRWQEVKTVASPEGHPAGQITLRHRDRWLTNEGRVTKDEYYVPARIRLDATCAHTLARASYVDAYDEVEVTPESACGTELNRRTKTFDWQVIDVDAILHLDLDYSHPACCKDAASECRPPPDGPGHSCKRKEGGDATDWTCRFQTLVVRRREVGGNKLATYWFAPGVGKVRELSKGEEIEHLVCFAVP